MAGQRVVLGLDPATRASGYAVLQGDRVLEAGVYVAVGAPDSGGHRLAQLAEIWKWAVGLVCQWQPAVVAVETVHHGPNAQTTIRLAEVGAAVRLAAFHAGRAVVDVSPAGRCQAIGAPTSAAKADIVRAVNLIYSLDLKDDNAADAVAIATAGAQYLQREALGLG